MLCITVMIPVFLYRIRLLGCTFGDTLESMGSARQAAEMLGWPEGGRRPILSGSD